MTVWERVRLAHACLGRKSHTVDTSTAVGKTMSIVPQPDGLAEAVKRAKEVSVGFEMTLKNIYDSVNTVK